MQRRRRGLASTSQVEPDVLSFPQRHRTRVRDNERGEAACATGTDDGESSTRVATGATRSRTRTGGTSRSERGQNAIGVLMPALALPENLSGYRPQDVGLLTHAAVAILAPTAQTLTPVEISERVLDVCGSLVNGDNVNRRRVLLLTAAGHVATYFRRLCPGSPWTLLGAEFDTGRGRTDLAWRDSATGMVFFDELKTHNRCVSALQDAEVGQVKRQALGGVSLYGEQFAGVRLIPFGALHLMSLVHPASSRMLLDADPAHPLRLADPQESL